MSRRQGNGRVLSACPQHGLQLAIAENEVPSTKAPDPYMHVFLDAGMGNVLAFFELPNSPKMGRDEQTQFGFNTSPLKSTH